MSDLITAFIITFVIAAFFGCSFFFCWRHKRNTHEPPPSPVPSSATSTPYLPRTQTARISSIPLNYFWIREINEATAASTPPSSPPFKPASRKHEHPPSPSQPFNWSKQEGYEAAAAAFSVISGVKIISQKDAKKQLRLGKKVKALEIKDVFYGRLSSYNRQAHDQEIFYIPDSAYDPRFDCDFTNYKGDDTNCTRGDYPYERPAGWNRKAVRVIGKYEDDVWLGQQGQRDYSTPGEWAVSYHGTKIQNVSSIVAYGYDTRKSVRQLYGAGIYSTPDPMVAESYAQEFKYNGEWYKCILQNRVNLEETEVVETGYDGTYFVTPDEDDIRPYGVCIKKN